MEERVKEKKLLDILAEERKYGALEELLENDPDYLYAIKCQDKVDKKLEKMNLNKKQAKQVNKLIAAVNQSGAAYGGAAYRQGLHDGIKLVSELRQIIEVS